MILVTGAGGKTGVAVLKALVARGAVVRALVRSNSYRAALNAIGVHDIVAGEMDDPRDRTVVFHDRREGREHAVGDVAHADM